MDLNEGEPADTAAAPAAEKSEFDKPQTKRFRKRFDSVRLSPEAAARQGKVATAAFLAFKDRDAMVAFLNTHHDTLGGRPIDLAVADDAGLKAVTEHLDAHGAAS